MRKLITLGFTAALLVAMMVVPGASMARKHRSCPRSATVDRNRDRLPDRWECRNRLSLRVKQTRRDQDRDGLNNLGEFRAGTNPRDADTDNDGLKDGKENAGTIASFTPSSDTSSGVLGTLVINLAGGGTVSGQVTNATEVECKSAAPTARASRDGDNSGPGSGENERGDDRGGDNENENEAENENENENEDRCSTGDLRAGRTVREAELKVTSAGAAFKDVEVVV